MPAPMMIFLLIERYWPDDTWLFLTNTDSEWLIKWNEFISDKTNIFRRPSNVPSGVRDEEK